MAAQIIRFGAPPQQPRFPAPPRPQSGFQIGGGDDSQSMMQMLALLQFLSSQESQRAAGGREQQLIDIQTDAAKLERQEALRQRTVGETTQVLGELDEKAAQTFNRFLRAQDKLAKAGRDSLDTIDRRAASLLGRKGTSLNNQKIDDFLETELPSKVAEIVSNTTDPTRLEGLQVELNRILGLFEGATATSSETIRIHRENTFRRLNQAHGPERQAERFNRLQKGFQDDFRQFKNGRQQEIQERLRRHDTDPEGTPRPRIFEAIDQSRELPDNLMADLTAAAQAAPGTFGAPSPTAPLVSPGTATIGQTEGLIPAIGRYIRKEYIPFGQEHPIAASVAGPIGTLLLKELEPFLFGDPGTQVGLPDAEAIIRTEQERTGLSNPENTAADPAQAAPVRFIEPQRQGPMDLDDLFRMIEQRQSWTPGLSPLRHGQSPVGPFAPQG